MNKNIILMIVLGLLIIASAVQAYQLTTLKTQIDEGSVKIGGTAAKTTTGTTATGNSLEDLPQMVGGC